MLTLQDVLLARHRIAPYAYRTPLRYDPLLSSRLGCNLFLKLEGHQHTGSFKVRGALNRIATLSNDDRRRGLVTASAGNHALGVAFAARAHGGLPVTVFLPAGAPGAKIEKLRAFGADIRLAGATYEDAHHAAQAYRNERGLTYVHAYDDPVVVAGQGTVGLEIMEDLPDVDVIVTPVGGGGLSAGIAVAARAASPRVRVVGVQPDASPAAYLTFRDGRVREEYEAQPTIADGLAGGYGRVPYEIAARLIDEIVVVREADIRRAVRALLTVSQEVVEGSAAAAIAPLLAGQLHFPGRNVVVVLTGRNIDAALIREILADEQT